MDITDHYYLIQAVPKKKIESLLGYTLITILSNADAAPLLLPFVTIGIIDKYFSHNISYSFLDMIDHGGSSAPGNRIHSIAAYTTKAPTISTKKRNREVDGRGKSDTTKLHRQLNRPWAVNG